VEIGVNAAARPARSVVCYTAVDQVEGGTVSVINSTAALPEITRVGVHDILGGRDMVERERAVIEDAARKLPAESLLDGQMLDRSGRSRIDDEHTVGVVAADVQAGRGGAVDRHVLAKRQRTGEQGYGLSGERICEVDRAARANSVQRLAEGSGTVIRCVLYGDRLRAIQAQLIQHDGDIRAGGD